MRRIRVVGVALLLVGLAACATNNGNTSHPQITVPSPGDCRAVDIAVAPEIAAPVRTLADSFNESAAAKLASGHCAFVRVWSSESSTIARQLEAGWPTPNVDGPMPVAWIPASSAWATLLNERLHAGGWPMLATLGPSLAHTRVVVAMPQPLAQAVRGPISWAALANLARHGWSVYGHPEWGSFRLGRPSPALGTDSLLTTLALNRDPAAREIERSVAYYGTTAHAFLDDWLHGSETPASTKTEDVSAVVTDERAIAAYNQGSANGVLPVNDDLRAPAPRTRLVAVTAPSAIAAADFPFVTLAGGDGAAAFGSFLRTPAASAAFKAAGFRPGAATVTPPHEVAAALDRWTQIRKPARVLVLFDISDSMRDSAGKSVGNRSKLTFAKLALIDALDRLGPNDEVGLRVFTTKMKKSSSPDWKDVVRIGRLADNRAHLENVIESLHAQQGSPLYVAATDAYNMMKRSYEPDRINGIVLLTDGYNEDEAHNNRDAMLKHLNNPNVRLFTIAYGSDADKSTLQSMARATDAGTYNVPNPIFIGTAFADALSNF